jgi:hypothetical protein
MIADEKRIVHPGDAFEDAAGVFFSSMVTKTFGYLFRFNFDKDDFFLRLFPNSSIRDLSRF